MQKLHLNSLAGCDMHLPPSLPHLPSFLQKTMFRFRSYFKRCFKYLSPSVERIDPVFTLLPASWGWFGISSTFCSLPVLQLIQLLLHLHHHQLHVIEAGTGHLITRFTRASGLFYSLVPFIEADNYFNPPGFMEQKNTIWMTYLTSFIHCSKSSIV